MRFDTNVAYIVTNSLDSVSSVVPYPTNAIPPKHILLPEPKPCIGPTWVVQNFFELNRQAATPTCRCQKAPDTYWVLWQSLTHMVIQFDFWIRVVGHYVAEKTIDSL